MSTIRDMTCRTGKTVMTEPAPRESAPGEPSSPDLLERILPKDICYCRACWRDDWHTPIRANLVVTLIATVTTLGLNLYLWPYRCVSCGHVRPRLAIGHNLSSDEPG